MNIYEIQNRKLREENELLRKVISIQSGALLEVRRIESRDFATKISYQSIVRMNCYSSLSEATRIMQTIQNRR